MVAISLVPCVCVCMSECVMDIIYIQNLILPSFLRIYIYINNLNKTESAANVVYHGQPILFFWKKGGKYKQEKWRFFLFFFYCCWLQSTWLLCHIPTFNVCYIYTQSRWLGINRLRVFICDVARKDIFHRAKEEKDKKKIYIEIL